MCGFVGYLCTDVLDKHVISQTVKNMGNNLSHRGPDDSGEWVDPDCSFGVSHQRLSILDLSPNGHQPMCSPSGRYVIAYNGEIYNFLELKKDLLKVDCVFKGESDTEVLLAAIEQWGINATLSKVRGMFAFALWDTVEKSLLLARDRMGEKPLYYGLVEGVFYFGSELKAFQAHPDWQGEIDREALALYVQFNYVPTPYSIYKGIKKLEPASTVKISLVSSEIRLSACQAYWDLNEVAQQDKPQVGTRESIEHLDKLIKASVEEKMIADVPVGAFLSGGVDSSIIAAQMQACSERPINTFTIGFHEETHNEARYAKKVADHLGTDHTELYINPSDTLAVVDKLPVMYDEPFADFSQIPTFLISQLARQNVTVCLSGDGGDELFGGYSRYQLVSSSWSKISVLPQPLRQLAATLLLSLPNVSLDMVFALLKPWFSRYGKTGSVSDKLKKVAEVLGAKNQQTYYQLMLSTHKKPEKLVLGGQSRSDFLWDSINTDDLSFFESMMLVDQTHYLSDDILVKVDRASMAVSLETRVPFLDHRIVEYAWQTPASLKYKEGKGKWLLQQVLYQHIPQSLVDRPKMGFSVPINAWLKGPLKDWAESLLDYQRLKQEGFFQAEEVRKKWQEHCSGKRDWQYHLWNILMFQVWLEENRAFVKI
jgi:asparagine synthase (glutamine-hydrolysing)